MSNSKCDRVERWLDEGQPRDGASAAEALELEGHAATCTRCRAALDAAVALETALRAPPRAHAPAGLAAGAMARIAAEDAAARRALAREGPPVQPAWWSRIASEPWTLTGAAGVVAVLAGRERLAALARSLATHEPGAAAWAPPPWLDQAFARWQESSAALAPHAQAAVALAVALAAGGFGWLLFRVSEAMFVRAAR